MSDERRIGGSGGEIIKVRVWSNKMMGEDLK